MPFQIVPGEWIEFENRANQCQEKLKILDNLGADITVEAENGQAVKLNARQVSKYGASTGITTFLKQCLFKSCTHTPRHTVYEIIDPNYDVARTPAVEECRSKLTRSPNSPVVNESVPKSPARVSRTKSKSSIVPLAHKSPEMPLPTVATAKSSVPKSSAAVASKQNRKLVTNPHATPSSDIVDIRTLPIQEWTDELVIRYLQRPEKNPIEDPQLLSIDKFRRVDEGMAFEFRCNFQHPGAVLEQRDDTMFNRRFWIPYIALLNNDQYQSQLAAIGFIARQHRFAFLSDITSDAWSDETMDPTDKNVGFFKSEKLPEYSKPAAAPVRRFKERRVVDLLRYLTDPDSFTNSEETRFYASNSVISASASRKRNQRRLS